MIIPSKVYISRHIIIIKFFKSKKRRICKIVYTVKYVIDNIWSLTVYNQTVLKYFCTIYYIKLFFL